MRIFFALGSRFFGRGLYFNGDFVFVLFRGVCEYVGGILRCAMVQGGIRTLGGRTGIFSGTIWVFDVGGLTIFRFNRVFAWVYGCSTVSNFGRNYATWWN